MRFSPPTNLRPSSQYAHTARYILSRSRHDLRIFRQPNVHARTEANHANTLTQANRVPGRLPAEHPPRDPPGDLLERNLAALCLQVDYVLLNLIRGPRAHRHKELPRPVLH